ncbi:MAG: hypothetical protein HZB25_05710 [Candidatus Eisenbacteria bacterium]|nr:hypothetical protein [Candidatus Eisenbacteria bacterium]
MRRTMFLVTLALLLAPTLAWSQGPRVLAPGDRIRITELGTTGSEPRTGTVTTAGTDSIVLKLDGVGEMMPFTWNRVASIEASHGRQRHTLTGAVIGLFVGALSGAVLGVTQCGVSCTGEEIGNKAIAPLIGAGIVGIAGMGVGAAIGAIYTTERWETVPASEWHASGRPDGTRGIGLRFSVGF